MNAIKKKILFVSHSSAWGGAEKCLWLLLSGLDRQKYDPLVVVPGEGDFSDRIRKLNIPVEIMDLSWWVLAKGESEEVGFVNFMVNFEKSLGALVDLIARLRVDLVYTNTLACPQGAFAAELAGVSHIWHAHELLSIDPDNVLFMDLSDFYGWVHALSDVIIVPSKCVGVELERFVPDSREVSVVYNANDERESDFKHPNLRDELGISPHDPVICFVGHLARRKGALDFIHMAEILLKTNASAKFIIAGRPYNVSDEVEHEIKSKNLQDSFYSLGFREDTWNVISGSDVLVLCSWAEPFGLVLIEAMRLGKPVVATKSGGPEEIVLDGETGRLVDTHDPLSMSQAVLSLINDPKMAREMGRKGAERAKQLFTADRYVRQIEALIDTASQDRKTFEQQKASSGFFRQELMRCTLKKYKTVQNLLKIFVKSVRRDHKMRRSKEVPR